MKPKYLWHGSIGKYETLKPKQALDISESPDCNLNAVYASDDKNIAILFGLIPRDIDCFIDYSKRPEKIVLINGKIRENKKFYLYMLNSENFEEKPIGSGQWVSFKEIVPIEIQELNTNDYLHLARYANKEDIIKYEKIRGMFSDSKV